MTANDLSTRNLVRLQPLIDWQLAKHLNGFPIPMYNFTALGTTEASCLNNSGV